MLFFYVVRIKNPVAASAMQYRHAAGALSAALTVLATYLIGSWSVIAGVVVFVISSFLSGAAVIMASAYDLSLWARNRPGSTSVAGNVKTQISNDGLRKEQTNTISRDVIAVYTRRTMEDAWKKSSLRTKTA